MGNLLRRNKPKSPKHERSSQISSDNSDENEFDPEYSDRPEDSQEEPETNEVHSNKRQASSHRFPQTSTDNRKRTSASIRRSTSTHHTLSPVQSPPSLTPNITVSIGQRNASLEKPKPHNSPGQNNTDSDDDNYESKSNHNEVRENPTTTGKFRRSTVDHRKSSTPSKHSDDDDYESKSNHNEVRENPTTTGKFRRSAVDHRKSSTPSRHSDIDVNRKTPITPIQNTSQPYFCPHCRQSMPPTTSKKLVTPQPPWIMEAPPTTKKHIDMDKYDEETMQENIISKYHRLPGSYNYFPNIVIDELEDNDDNISNKYVKQTTITRHGSSISPTHTPYPNYDLLQRHEYRLNKPFTSK